MMKTDRALVLVTFLMLFSGCESGPAESPEWDAFADEHLEAFFTAHPCAAVGAGRHEFDGRLPDWSREGIEREIARLHVERERALAFDNASLSDPQRFERNYLLAWIDRNLFWIEEAEWPFLDAKSYRLAG